MRELYQVLPIPKKRIPAGENASFAEDVIYGLSQRVPAIPPKYFYDERGSELFEQITELPEYYLTRCEREILSTHGSWFASEVQGSSYDLVELGAGDGSKAALVIEHLLRADHDFRFRPIDISEGAMQALTDRLHPRFPCLDLQGVVAEYIEGLEEMKALGRRKVVLFLGSNIGNFASEQSFRFLHTLHGALNPGDFLLIGFDLKKELSLLRQAYSDPRGVTAEFNFNLLRRINRELGGDFDLKKFRHYAAYNFRVGAMESFLVSTETQTVTLREVGTQFHFDAWQAIYTECSYKYSPNDICRMAQTSGFSIVGNRYDSAGYFCDSLWVRQ